MKKQILSFILIGCFMFFIGCSSNTADVTASVSGQVSPDITASAPKESAMPTVSAAPAVSESTTEPSESSEITEQAGAQESAWKIEFKDIEIDQAVNDYFNGDAKAEINKMYTLLISAAMAEFAEGKPLYPDENPDTGMEWVIVYQYLNSYGEENSGIEMSDDGVLVLSKDKMLEIFQSFFSFFKGSLPAINTNYAISYDEDSGTYIVGRSDFGDISFAVSGVTLSEANNAADSTISATVALTAIDTDGNSAGVILVEIVPNNGSVVGYSIQSLTME